MAAAAVEVAAEAAEAAAPEAEAIGTRAEAAGRNTMERLADVGTGVLIGQSLSSKSEESAPASAPAPAPASAPAPAPAYTGGQPVVYVRPRPLAEKFQAAVLVVLVIIIIATVFMISVRRPGSQTSFWIGMVLGALTGAAGYWVSNSFRR